MSRTVTGDCGHRREDDSDPATGIDRPEPACPVSGDSAETHTDPGDRPAGPRRDLPPTLTSLPPGPSDSDATADQGSDPDATADQGEAGPALPGTVPGYLILGEVGRGAMGVVYQARQVALKRVVALKMILGGAHAGTERVQRFRAEAEAIARLQHPNIVQIYEVGEHDRLPFFSLEFVDGGSLSHRLRGEPQRPAEAARLLEKLAQAMDAAHRAGVVHRDLKPANVLLSRNSEFGIRNEGAAGNSEFRIPNSELNSLSGFEPKVTDFGIAKHLEEDSSQTRSGVIMGTPSYMAPEQAAGKTRAIGPRADVYALGAILYECLTGRPPFKAASAVETLDLVRHQEPVPPSRLQPKLPRDLETICLKCLQKDQARRYPTARALAEDLRRFLNNEPVHARPIGPAGRAVKWARRRPAVALLIVAGLVALFSLGGLGWVSARYEREQVKAVQDKLNQERELRGRVAGTLARARTAVRGGRWDEANNLLQKALGTIASNPALQDLQTQAEELQAEVNRHIAERAGSREAREQYRKFLPLRDEALFHATLCVGDQVAPHLRQTQEAAGRALACFGLSPDHGGAPPLHASLAAEKQEIIRDCYELLLVWAEAAAQALPGDAEAAVRERAREALRILDRAAAFGPPVHPSHAYHSRRARYLDQAGDPASREEAARERQRAERLPAATALDHYLLGDELYKNDNVALAVPHFEAAVKLEPDRFWPRYFRALCSLRLNAFADAKADLTICLNQRPFTWAHLMRGFAEEQLGEYAAAEGDFAAAEQLETRNPEPEARYALYANRGVLRVRQGHYAEAVEDLQRATRLQPARHEAYLSLAQAYQHQKRWGEAVAVLGEAIRLKPDDETLAQLYRNRAWCRLEQNDLARALEDFESAGRTEPPENAPARARDQGQRGWIFLQEKRLAQALEAYDDAVRLWPGYLKGYLGRGKVLLKLDRDREAADALDQYLAQGGKPLAEVYETRGLARSRLGRHRGAADDYAQALQIRAGGHRLAGAAAWGLGAGPLPGGALPALGILAADPGDGGLHAACGWSCLKCESAPQALVEFDAAVRLDPENGENRLGRAYARLAATHPPEKGRPDLEGMAKFVRDLDDAAADVARAAGPASADGRTALSAARALALAVARLDVCPVRYRPELLARRQRFQDQALGFLTRAVELAPGDRAAFWRKDVEGDPAFVPLQLHPGYTRLALKYRRAAN